jgi:hypothetical protein
MDQNTSKYLLMVCLKDNAKDKGKNLEFPHSTIKIFSIGNCLKG